MNANLYALIEDHFPAQTEQPCVLVPGGPIVRYDDLAQASARVANALTRAGCRPGDRVAVQSDKHWHVLALYLACLRAGLVYLPCTVERDFTPPFPDRPVDLVYLCYPNNPTGAVMTREALARWVAWARANGTVLLYDAAYEAYIRDAEIPHSIYEVPGAREVAIEFRSFSKTAGFTGTRCAFTVVPEDLRGRAAGGQPVDLNGLWLRRQSTKFNGVPYVVQRGAAAVYTDEGQQQVRAAVDYYMENARIIREGLHAAGLTVHGGRNAPYLWVKTPPGLTSWDFFDRLLRDAHVVGTPGAGFGPSGEGYVRLTAFGRRDHTEEAVARIRRL